MQATQIDMFAFKTPAMPTLDVTRCKVRVTNHVTAAAIVKKHHYAHRVPSIVAAFALFVDDTLAGVITYGMPAAPKLNVCGAEFRRNQLELTRLFVFDWCGKNTESWFIAQTFKLLPQKWPEYFILVSYADSAQEHIGYIYQATNWLYTGLSIPGGNPSEMSVNGERMSSKAAYDRWGSQGVKELEALGLKVIKGKGTIKHRYVHFLGDKRQRKTCKKALRWDVQPYPKQGAGTDV